MKNTQNKSQIFVENASVRLKEDSLKTHMSSNLHAAAVEADLTQRLSIFHKAYVYKNEVQTTVIKKVFSTAYFIMTEIIANRKLILLIDFMEKILGVSDFKNFAHRSEGSIKDIYLTLGQTVKQTILDKVKKASSFGLLTDEVTDISVCSQLVTFIQFWDRDTQAVETLFLSTQNVLEYFDSCNSEAISTLLLNQLEECGLDVKKLMGLSTNGASVMVGKSNGVAAKLRTVNKKLLNIHCVCHRLALACTDSCQELKYIKQVEDVLRQLWYYFQNSPKKMACFLKCQLALKKIHLTDQEKTKKVLSRRLKKACQTRWLSFGSSVRAALKDYEAILLTLQQIDDATGVGLLKKMKQVKFLGALYILDAILPLLNILSKQFQAGNFHFSMVKPAKSQMT